MGQDVGNPSEYQFAISGLLLVVMAVLYPDGITGVRHPPGSCGTGSHPHDREGTGSA